MKPPSANRQARCGPAHAESDRRLHTGAVGVVGWQRTDAAPRAGSPLAPLPALRRQSLADAKAAAKVAGVETAAGAEWGEGDATHAMPRSAVEGTPVGPTLPFPKLDISFAWHAWFGDAWSKVTVVGQLIQASIAGSTQEQLECLVGEGPMKNLGQMKYLVPAMFWVLYPLFVVI